MCQSDKGGISVRENVKEYIHQSMLQGKVYDDFVTIGFTDSYYNNNYH